METWQPAQDKAPSRNGGANLPSPPELTGSSAAAEAGGQPMLDHEVHGYPIAVGHFVGVGELEGRE